MNVDQVYVILQPPSSPQSSSLVTSILVSNCLQYSNSAMNPLLYAGLSDNFRKSFRKVIIITEASSTWEACEKHMNCNCRRVTAAYSGKTQTHSQEITPSPQEEQFGVPVLQRCFRKTLLPGWGAGGTHPPMSPQHLRGPRTALLLGKLVLLLHRFK